MNTIAEKSQLWTPGDLLQEVYHEPGPSEFCLHFANTVWNGTYENDHEFVTLEDSLAAMRTPNRPPSAIAIIDLDDMIGNLGLSLRKLMYPTKQAGPEHFTHDYGEGLFFSDADKSAKHPLIRFVKQHGMEPVRDIEAIRQYARSWRAAGVYVTFVTSAIPGAELDHINFVAKHFNQACDGMIITKGDYKLVDKGIAAQKILDFVRAEPGTPVVHLDDLSHNTANVRTALENDPRKPKVGSFQHVFTTGTHLGIDPEATACATPLETFAAANNFLEENLGGLPIHFSWPLLAASALARQTAERGGRLLIF